MSENENRARRRRHKAAGGRVAASGLGAGALLGIVGALGAHAPSTAAATKLASTPLARRPIAGVASRSAPVTTPTTIVWRVVHRVVVVTDPPVAENVSSSGGGAHSTSVYVPAPMMTASAPVAPGPAAPPPVASAPPPPPAPAPAPAPPACHGSKCP
jgi:hypothetical protein